jgi:hypothetical protein
MIFLLNQKATKEQMNQMLESLGTYIKLAVDIERGIAVGGGILHADCEAILLQDGSKQENIWGADWIPNSQELAYEALINIRPKQGNMTMTINDENIRKRINEIVTPLFKDI